MRVLIIDDSAFMRKALHALIASEPSFEIVGTARNGREGLEKIAALKPDLVTLDLEMPVMDGLAVLEHLRQTAGPRPLVLMCSTLTGAGSHAALRAMRLGAADVIEKDPEAMGANRPEARSALLAKLRAMGETRRRCAADLGAPGGASVRSASPPPRDPPIPAPLEAIVIGSSTGGPPILEQLVAALPADLGVPVIIAQHMPRLFTRSIAERLNELRGAPVQHAEADTPLQKNVYIVAGGLHGRIARPPGGVLRLEVNERPTDAFYKPSVLELFMSAARTLLGRCVGVMLTGMGDDGVKGAKALHAAGATVVTQSEETCVVYGMPRAVVEAGASTAALPPDRIAHFLRAAASGGGAARHAG